MTDRELLQQALDAIEAALSDDQPYISRSKETVEALRSRLAQPEPWVKTYSGGKPNYTEPCERCGEVNPAEIHTCTPKQPKPKPVAVWELQEGGWDTIADAEWMETLPIGTKLYTSPPQREWQGLTTDELNLLWVDHHGDECLSDGRILSYERAIEAKLKQKNCGSHD